MLRYTEAIKIPERGYAIVVPGLNTHADVFNDITGALTQRGWHVVLAVLTGHHDDYQAFQHVTTEQWIGDVQEAFERVKALNTVRLPVVLFGYSLGALTTLVAAARQSLPFQPNAWVLMAPAIRPRKTSYIVKASFFFPEHWSIKSYSPKGYAAQPRVPVAAYRALFSLVDEAAEKKAQLPAGPALLLFDPKDELVSLPATLELIKAPNLAAWHLVRLPISRRDKQNRFHHLIVDRASMRPDQWEGMWETIDSFISESLKRKSTS